MTVDRGTRSQHPNRAAAGCQGPPGQGTLVGDVATRLSRRPTRVRGRRPLLGLLRRRKPSGGRLRRSTMVPPQMRGRGRGEDELGDYIERELKNGRNLFDVLGDRNVWAELEDDPLLISRVAASVLPKS